uniref:Uncharacterized protein n=1 Tax=Arundo donax TaxID=35708 RepID=A0A0A8Y432_ARUDO
MATKISIMSSRILISRATIFFLLQ